MILSVYSQCGRTALMVACSKNHVAVAEVLLKNHASVDLQNKVYEQVMHNDLYVLVTLFL